jgi:hypothetical protein
MNETVYDRVIKNYEGEVIQGELEKKVALTKLKKTINEMKERLETLDESKQKDQLLDNLLDYARAYNSLLDKGIIDYEKFGRRLEVARGTQGLAAGLEKFKKDIAASRATPSTPTKSTTFTERITKRITKAAPIPAAVASRLNIEDELDNISLAEAVNGKTAVRELTEAEMEEMEKQLENFGGGRRKRSRRRKTNTKRRKTYKRSRRNSRKRSCRK